LPNFLELILIALLLVSLVLPLTSSAEYAFTSDASLMPSPEYFGCDDESFEILMKKKYFFMKFFSFFRNDYCCPKKSVYNVQHRYHGINFRKIK
jgi:hypothetical protein